MSDCVMRPILFLLAVVFPLAGCNRAEKREQALIDGFVHLHAANVRTKAPTYMELYDLIDSEDRERALKMLLILASGEQRMMEILEAEPYNLDLRDNSSLKELDHWIEEKSAEVAAREPEVPMQSGDKDTNRPRVRRRVVPIVK